MIEQKRSREHNTSMPKLDLLAIGALERLGLVAVVLALLWLATAWALA